MQKPKPEEEKERKNSRSRSRKEDVANTSVDLNPSLQRSPFVANHSSITQLPRMMQRDELEESCEN